jgi:hypothetical protein
VLYVRDEAGNIVRSRHPGVTPPLLHIVRTARGNRWMLSASLTGSKRSRVEQLLKQVHLAEQLQAMEEDEPALGRVRALLEPYEPLAVVRGPAFWFDAEVVGVNARATILAELDAPTVPELAWIRDATSEERPLAVARNVEGQIVSVCHSARSSERCAEAGVETASAYRGRGLAGEVARSWATAVQAQGRVALYSTQWTNVASRAVARKLGLTMYGEDVAIVPASRTGAPRL